jgi:hypothetical protein
VFNRILKFVFALPLIIVMLLIVVVNVRLGYHPPLQVANGDTTNTSLIKQIRALSHAVHAGADRDMQRLYPEGYVFMNAIYALSWTSFLQHGANKAFYNEGHDEIRTASNKINSAEARRQFSEELLLPYGAYYNGWATYVLGAKLSVEAEPARDTAEVNHFRDKCDVIALAVQKSVYPSSYYGAAWPADVVMCIAALHLHDKLFSPKYQEVISSWVREVRLHLDPNGMIPHGVDAARGISVQNARGSSLALMLIFLRDIDMQLAREQFTLFEKNFLDTTLGLTGIREYSKGTTGGVGDIDSGPVILGYGGAAMITGAHALSLYGDKVMALRVRSVIEAFGFPSQTADEKKYFYGLIPIADAFIAWGDNDMSTTSNELFVVFRIYSTLMVLLLSIFFWILVSEEKRTLIVGW